ncbi:hypothetical protein PRZ48_013392 [Zasmidium cellare]|uniref:FAD-binding FR-type domain-containing protein n=1 Tax=Zasmidium cellare TaxID=395010 RepID=A0ABR0E0X6_ZASCE|nr:hypothetical protein PRZ48_013392 [Zasmidium cellare]
MAPKALLLTSLLVTSASAITYLQRSQYCVAACSAALNHVSFDGKQPASASHGSPVPCSDKNYVQSLFYCASIYCTPDEARSGLGYSNATCLSEAGKPLPNYLTFMGHPPSGPAEKVMRVSERDVKKQKYTQSVVPDQDFYDVGYDSTVAQNRATYYNWNFAWALYGYWGLVIFIGMSNRAIQYLRHRRSQLRLDLIKGESFGRQSNSPIARTGTWIRRHLVLPLAFGNHRETPFTVPTRVEGILIGLYVVMNFVFCFPGYHTFEGNLYAAETRIQLGQYFCNRAGTLAIANIPIIWIFATRNDPFLWLTGWSHASFSQFHRWAARTATLLAIAHGAGYSIIDGWEGEYHEAWKKEFWYCGAISVISMSMLVVSSLYFVRNRWYDVFLGIHFIFALMLLVCIWFHVKIQYGAFNGFIWPAVAIWSLDRLLRWTRILCISALPNLKGIKATATFDETKDLIRLDVTEFFKKHAPIPGSFYYVYEPGRLRGYESHPFTLCTWNHAIPASRSSSSMSSLESPIEKEVEKAPQDPSDVKDVELGMVERTPTDDPIPDKRKSAEAHHTFLIRPRNGFTGRLRTKTTASSGETKSKDIRVLIEGPYGCELTLHQYSTVVLVVGGAGITAAISRMYSLLRTAASPHFVRLVWATQKREVVDDICAHELDGVLGNPRLRADFYITSSPTSSSRVGERKSITTLGGGRPDIDAILQEERSRCQGSMAVFCCGPPSMEASTRNGVVKLLGEKGPHVAFYQERFGCFDCCYLFLSLKDAYINLASQHFFAYELTGNMANLQSLPKDILVLLPDYLHNIEDYTNLSSTCRKLRECMQTALPNTILRLAVAQSRVFFRPSPHFLFVAVAREVGHWARQSDANEQEFVEHCRGGVDALLDLALDHCGITMERIRELHRMRCDIINPVTDIIDRCVGDQWHAQEDFWDTVEDAYTIDSDAPETFFHLAIYGELFGPDFEATLNNDSRFRNLKPETRIEFVKYCMTDPAVASTEEYEAAARAVKRTTPYDPDNYSFWDNWNHNIALTWVIKSKTWKPYWKAMREKAGPEFQDDFDDGWFTHNGIDQDWRQRMWENGMLCQGLEGFEMIRPHLQDQWISKVKEWREKIEKLDREPPSTKVGKQTTLEYPYLLGDLRICAAGYVLGT